MFSLQQDIRSFFSVGAKKPAQSVAPNSAQKRKPIVLDDSDNEDDKKPNGVSKTKSPSTSSKQSSQSKKRRVFYSSDEDEPKTSNDKKSTVSSKVSQLKTVNVGSVFGDQPIKRIEKEKKSKKKAESDVFDADTDDMELMNVDEELLSPKLKKLDIKKEKQLPATEKLVLKTKNDKTPEKVKIEKNTPEKVKTEKKTPEKVKIEKKTPVKKEKHSPQESEGSSSKKTSGSSKKKKADKKPKHSNDDEEIVDLDQSVFDTDQEKHEKRRAAAMLYQQFQKRSGPSNPGSKEIPKGKPNCLAGLTFVLTGVYESMERDEADSVITSFGGRVTKALSGKTNYMVAGEDSGPAKLAKAEDMKISIISEDELLDLIREKSGMPTLKKKTKVKETDMNSPKKSEKMSPKKRDHSSSKHESPKKPKVDEKKGNV